MKICVLTHSFPRNKWDVAAAFMKEFCDGLVENANQVVVITPFDPKFSRKGDKFKIITYKYIWPSKLHYLGYSRAMEADVKLKFWNFLLLPFMLFFGTIKLLKTIYKEKIDLISVHWILPNGLIALIASKITGVPYTVTLPGTDTYLASRFRIFGLMSKIVAINSKGLFSNSSWHLNKILKLGVGPLIASVITYPVDTNKFKPTSKHVNDLRKKLKFSKENLVLLAVGRLVYKKGFNYLIEAIPKVTKEYPNLRLIIGGDGNLLSTWKDLTKKLKVENKIFFVGTIKRNEILYYYNLADIMVTPSILDDSGNIDGRPLVILESMACGKPQIVTKLPGISDSLKDGVNAILVKPRNSSEIALAISKIASSKILRQKMGQANRKLAIKNLSTRNIGKAYTDCFRQII